MKQIWEEGFKAYVRQWWNWLDFIMLTLFLASVGLRVVGMLLRKTGKYGAELAGREDWPADDPTLLSEAFFAIAHIFSFARIIFLFQVCSAILLIALQGFPWKKLATKKCMQNASE